MQDKQVKHPNEMNEQELRNLVWSMSEMALNLAQHLESTEMLKVQYRKNCYQRAIKMAWEICYAWKYEQHEGNMTIAYIGDNGLEVTKGDVSQLLDGTLPVASSENPDEFDFNDFEQLYMELDSAIPSIEEIAEGEKSLRYLNELTLEKVGRDHVDVKVKTLKQMMWKLEFVTNLAKASRKMLDMIDKDVWQPKANILE
jgi:hypothetical protein